MKYLPIAIHLFIILLILLFTFAPVLSVAYASSVATANNCDLDEGSIHPCVVNGKDIGADLYSYAMMGWLMIATIPLGLGALLVYLAGIGLYYLIRWYLRRKRAEPAAT